MDLSRAIEMMSYDPRFSWVSNSPLVYFNKHTLAAGEQFKVLVRYPQWHGSPYLSISTAGADGEQIITKELIPSRFWDPARFGPNHQYFYYGTVVNTTDELQVGAYVARVVVPGPEGEISLAGAQHSFHVHKPDFYTARLQEMMGDTWDEPVYLDEVEGAAAEDLLLSLPADEVLSFLPESAVLDNGTICRVLGPLMTTFMQGAMGPLPFSVDHRVSIDTTRLPHIDLVKSVWLLNAIAPAWADMMFFSGACIVSCRVDDQSVVLDIEGYLPDPFYQRYTPAEEEQEEQETLPPLVTTVTNNIRNELDCDIKWAPSLLARIRIRE